MRYNVSKQSVVMVLSDKNKFGEFLRNYRQNEKKMTLRDLSKITGISFSHLGKIERGEHNPSRQTIEIIADSLGLPKDKLLLMAGYAPDDRKIDNLFKNVNNDLPKLTPHDEKNITKDLEEILNSLESGRGYAHFDGQSIEDLDEEDRELLKASLETSLRIAKQIAKKKYTPKKYRKN